MDLFSTPQTITESIEGFTQHRGQLTVSLSNELVQLLSDQLYQSPIKAIEELVVNSYDAGAKECRVSLTDPANYRQGFIAVFDDGEGMDYDGLVNLWHIGRSNKRTDEVARRVKRKQIGKFGIGKLATYTIANRITYVTRTNDEILSVSLDYRDFKANPTGGDSPVQLEVKLVDDWMKLASDEGFKNMCLACGIKTADLFSSGKPHWTFVILEELKPKVQDVRIGRLRWVLQTAMPLADGFALYLNDTAVISAKESYKKVVEFTLADIPDSRIKDLESTTKDGWAKREDGIYSRSFPSGITGSVFVTEQSLAGKSDDLGRSHGFFVRVRNRLINEESELFGLRAQSFETAYRFRADIDADDLDDIITAPREGVEASTKRETFKDFLHMVFLEARDRNNKRSEEKAAKEERRKEHDRNFVNPQLVEQPIADAIVSRGPDLGSDADDNWFYLDIDPDQDRQDLVKTLYSSPRESKYQYEYTQRSRVDRLVKFNPVTSTFVINGNHDLIKAHEDDPRARVLLEDLVTAEALLEVYLREHQVPSHTIGSILERRDKLLRSLAHDHPFSLKAIAAALREAKTHKYDLEVHLVTAIRALGFVSKHISGEGEPDGLARLTEFPRGEKKIILEAKSSQDVPSLGSLDFGGLHQHMVDYEADGCLLVAPDYPGTSREEDSAASKRAQNLRISCWTVDQLARVVEAAESHHVTARQVLDIVLQKFSPQEVADAVEQLFEGPSVDRPQLYAAILEALADLDQRLADLPRTWMLVAGEVSRHPAFNNIGGEDVRKAINEVAAASQGGITFNGEIINIHTSYSELSRRLAGLTKRSVEPRRASTFRDGF